FSQSTVSFQIKQLETELGVQLFERINHTVVLTEKGREVLKFAQTVHQMTRSLKDSILHSETITGHVRLAMADSLCGVMLEDFGTFRQQYPGITLKITAAGTQEMFRLLNQIGRASCRESVDLGVRRNSKRKNNEQQLTASSETHEGSHIVANKSS